MLKNFHVAVNPGGTSFSNLCKKKAKFSGEPSNSVKSSFGASTTVTFTGSALATFAVVVARSINGSAVFRCAVVKGSEPGKFTCLTFEVESCGTETTFVDLVIDPA